MNQIIAILQIVVQLLPIVKTFIMAVEEAVPATGQGAAKIQMVKDMTANAFKAVDTVQATFEQVWPLMQVMVTSLVAMYNATGQFKKGTQAQ